MLYKTKGFVFYEKNGEIQRCPFDGVKTTSYKAVHDMMKDVMKIKHYMFILREVKE